MKHFEFVDPNRLLQAERLGRPRLRRCNGQMSWRHDRLCLACHRKRKNNPLLQGTPQHKHNTQTHITLKPLPGVPDTSGASKRTHTHTHLNDFTFCFCVRACLESWVPAVEALQARRHSADSPQLRAETSQLFSGARLAGWAQICFPPSL